METRCRLPLDLPLLTKTLSTRQPVNPSSWTQKHSTLPGNFVVHRASRMVVIAGISLLLYPPSAFFVSTVGKMPEQKMAPVPWSTPQPSNSSACKGLSSKKYGSADLEQKPTAVCVHQDTELTAEQQLYWLPSPTHVCTAEPSRTPLG